MIGGGDRLELSARSVFGDRTGTALVGADGTIDWWSPFGIDQPATLFSLIDGDRGAALGIALDVGVTVPPEVGTQRWAFDGAPIVETVLTGRESSVRIRDCMYNGTIYRDVCALRGPATIVVEIRPGFRFGPARKQSMLSDGMAFGPTLVRGAEIATPLVLDSGERLLLCVSPTGTDARLRFEEFDRLVHAENRRWRSLIDTNYDGPHPTLVRDSIRQLLLLVNPTSGALSRAATTSLPARDDHERQVDSRLAWLDDAARFVSICERFERFDLAEVTREWLAAAIDDPTVGAARTLSSGAVPPDRDLNLSGWRGHQPTVSGHRGATKTDLAALAAASLVLDARRHRKIITRTARHLHQHAYDVDAGRWGGRGRPARHVSAAIATRRALEAAAETERRFDPLSEEAADWHATARDLGNWLAAEGCFGLGHDRGWRRTSDDDSSDAQLLRWIVSSEGVPGRSLLQPVQLPGDVPGEANRRVQVSLDQTLAQLEDSGLLHRHLPHVDDGFAPGQPCDLGASFEVVTVLASVGRWDEATEHMERAIGVGQGSGTFTLPTFIDAQRGVHRGDRPSAPSLLGFLEAAITLSSGPS